MPAGDHELIEEKRTHSIIGAFYDVYNELDFGFLESVYSAAMVEALLARGHVVAREVPVPVFFRGKEVARQRLDMLVDDCVVVENKSTERLSKSAIRVLYNYLKATRMEVGLLLHFGPDAKFYRLVCTNSKPIRVNPPNPPNRSSR